MGLMMFNFIKYLLPKRVVIKREVVFTGRWIEIDYKSMETSHDEILITNDRGWYRICTCLGNRRGTVDFYDAYDAKIKGFNPTHYIKLLRPISGVSYDDGV